jgi:cysteine-rich repeat protein
LAQRLQAEGAVKAGGFSLGARRYFAAWAGAALILGCGSDDGAAAKTKCTAGVNVFCRCSGGEETGTMACLPGGQSFGPCLPCDSGLVEDVGRREEDLASAEDTSRRGQEVTQDDAGSTGTDAAGDTGAIKCSAFAVPLTSAKDVSLSGDTSLAKATLAGLGLCAAGNQSKDIAYEVVADERGKITATVTPGAGFDAVLYERSGPCGQGNQSMCADKKASGGAETITFFAEAGDKHYVVVDGKNGSAGSYALKLQLAPGSYCGDGVVDPEEACDDGNLQAGDGCSATCKPDGAPKAAETCPGQLIHLWQLPVALSGDTNDHPNLQKGSCGGGGGRDAVFQIMPHRDGTMTATAASELFDALIYARNSACSPGQELACANKTKDKGAETIAIPVTSGVPVWLIVDGYKYGKGPFTLALAVD